MFGLMQDRPLLIVHRKPDTDVTKGAKSWLPDDVQFVEAIPHTAKILKIRLREDFKNYRLPTE